MCVALSQLPASDVNRRVYDKPSFAPVPVLDTFTLHASYPISADDVSERKQTQMLCVKLWTLSCQRSDLLLRSHLSPHQLPEKSCRPRLRSSDHSGKREKTRVFLDKSH